MKSRTLGQILSFELDALAFGTSGLRGLVKDLSQLEVAINTIGFLRFLRAAGAIGPGARVWFAGDLRPSTIGKVEVDGLPRGEILQAVAWAVRKEGCEPGYLGLIPTPALMAYSLGRGEAGIMVTGSHIPFDRNGIKFNRPDGEVLKTDEPAILDQVQLVRAQLLGQPAKSTPFAADGQLKSDVPLELPPENEEGRQAYLRRYTEAFPEGPLRGRRILVYQHSAVGRDLLVDLLKTLGAEVTSVGRSDRFIPVDTEAVQPSMLRDIQEFVEAHGGSAVDAVVSTDGDSDRPLLLGVDGGEVRFFSGDLLGIVAADFFGARHVAVPISANDAVDRFFAFKPVQVVKTRIGSPHVIAAMREVGWEANGGFLTARPCKVPGGGTVPPLPTRDAFLPLLAALYASIGKGLRIVDVFNALPQRFGKANVIRDFPREISLKILDRFLPADRQIEEVRLDGTSITVRRAGQLHAEPASVEVAKELSQRRTDLETAFGEILEGAPITWMNFCDGCRFSTDRGEILHLRPSGNAPEQRVYAVADSAERAEAMVNAVVAPGGIMEQLRQSVDSTRGTTERARRASGDVPVESRTTDLPPILELEGVIKHYDWGGTTFIPNLLDRENPSEQPHAELWLGAHPSASATLRTREGVASLRHYIKDNGAKVLGPHIVEHYGAELPFLFKILDARKMLSIQAHPDREQARDGFAREEEAGMPRTDPSRNYKDPFPKPEVHVAVTRFWMLHGFRPLEQVAELTRCHPETAAAWPDLEMRLQKTRSIGDRHRLLREVYERVMRMPQHEVDAVLRPLLDRLKTEQPQDKSDPAFWLARAATAFAPEDGACDRGLFSIFLLNLVHLQPGQSTFQDAGVLHAYLEGITVELMAASDNVLRGGLTNKHVDVEELLRIVRFEEQTPSVSRGTPVDDRETVFATPAAEFELSHVVLDAGARRQSKSDRGPECLLVLEGAADLRAAAHTLRLSRGRSAWVNWGVDYTITATGSDGAILFRASTPSAPAG